MVERKRKNSFLSMKFNWEGGKGGRASFMCGTDLFFFWLIILLVMLPLGGAGRDKDRGGGRGGEGFKRDSPSI